MLRLDPGEGRIRTARQFRVWEGGGEYNVARGLARCFGLRTAIVTALVDNEVGHLVEGLVLAGGVDTELITWVADDGIGRDVRNGLNFTERGFGVRGAKGVSDRGRSAASQLRPDDIDWDAPVRHVGACAGSTPAASSPACRPAPRTSWSPPWRRRAGTAPWCPTTSTIDRACGHRSGARPARAR